MQERGRSFFLIFIALLAVGSSFFGGVLVGYKNVPAIEKISSLSGKEPEPGITIDTERTDFSPFWRAWNIINEKYNGDNATTTDEEKVWGAIQGLVGSLEDPYSVFFPPVEATAFEETISGNFGGVGIEIGIRDELLTVIAPLKGTPAERAGILTGDKIVEVNGASVVKTSIDEAVGLIRGEIGTTVALTILREGKEEPLKVELVRAVITIPTIDTEVREAEKIFIIKLYNFSAVSPNLFRDALRDFVLSGYDSLILDIRGNTGGFLQAAVEIGSWFLPGGKIIVTEDYGDRREDIIHRSKGYDIFNESLKMAVLVNGGSASASEILAGALSEHGIAKLVGEKTFGKGSVQEVEKVTPETSLKITVAHWKTPNGNSISDGGLTPDFEVQITDEDRTEERDPQLDKAIQILLSQT